MGAIVTKAEVIDNSDHRVDYSLRLHFSQEEQEDLGGYYSLATYCYEPESLARALWEVVEQPETVLYLSFHYHKEDNGRLLEIWLGGPEHLSTEETTLENLTQAFRDYDTWRIMYMCCAEETCGDGDDHD